MTDKRELTTRESQCLRKVEDAIRESEIFLRLLEEMFAILEEAKECGVKDPKNYRALWHSAQHKEIKNVWKNPPQQQEIPIISEDIGVEKLGGSHEPHALPDVPADLGNEALFNAPTGEMTMDRNFLSRKPKLPEYLYNEKPKGNKLKVAGGIRSEDVDKFKKITEKQKKTASQPGETSDDEG